MDRWEPAFCERLAAAGRYVIRYDHRDTGGSTHWPPGEPGYTRRRPRSPTWSASSTTWAWSGRTLVGLSMGGALAQHLAVEQPERVASLALLSTTPGRRGRAGAAADVRRAARRVLRRGRAASRTGPTARPRSPTCSRRSGRTRAAAASTRRRCARSSGAPTTARPARRAPTTTSCSTAARSRPRGSGRSTRRCSSSTAPTTRCSRPRTARRSRPPSPAPQLLVLDGVGHELPRSAWDEVLPALIELTRPRDGG